MCRKLVSMETTVTRQTRQKRAIFAAIQASGRALSMEEILERGREKYSRLSERTVFRQLKELMDEHQLVRVYLPGQPARYELPTFEHRPHFICRKCGQVYVLPDEIPDIASNYTPPEGFHIDGEDVVFFGICPECQDK